MVGDHTPSSASPAARDSTTPSRELSVDFYRVLAMVFVVSGHWLVSAVTFRDGRFGNDYPLVVLPWTQWLTLLFQVVPVFFLVGGYASAASWMHQREAGFQHGQGWVRSRLGVILGPTTAYVLLVLATVAVLGWIGAPGSRLSFGGWAVAMHLWFVPVYLLVVLLTPVAMAAHRRWGLAVPAVLALAVAGVDGAARLVPEVGLANYLLCWAAVYQIGICWRSGAFGGRRPMVLAASAAIVVAVLLATGTYPIAMVGAPGATAQNNFPPTVALLAFAVAQSGLLIAVAPAVTRWLRRSRLRRFLAAANRNVMAVYLWQMVPVVVVALVGYPTGLLPQPEPGTGAWWLFRLAWLVILVAVTAVELTLLWLARAVFNRALPAVTIPLPAWTSAPLLVVGTAVAALSLAYFAVEGFAPSGHFPTTPAWLYVLAVGLVCVRAKSAAAEPQRC